MARPIKQTVDYFPHQCTHGKTLFIMEKNFGNDGYAFWFKLLEMLGQAEGHVLDAGNPAEWEFLTAKTLLNDDTAGRMLDMLAKLEAIDAGLWECRLIWCQKFVDGVKDAYRKRIDQFPQKPGFRREKLPSDGVSGGRNPDEETFPAEPSRGNGESKGKESKLKKTFLSDSIEIGLSELLFSLIKKANPNHKQPNFQSWAKIIDLMIRIDNRSPDDIESIIRWCQQDSFWAGNILSTEKLRKQFDTLVIKRNQNENGFPRLAACHAPVINEEFLREQDRKLAEIMS